MSTPDYDMAPPAATATAPPPAAASAPASGAAPAADPTAPRAQRRRSTSQASQNDSSLNGLLIPGGVITGMISLCWLIHHFGLPIVLFSIMTAAATAAAVAVVRVSRRAARAAGRNRVGQGAGGAGPGGGRRGGPSPAGGGRSGGGRLGAGNRAGGGPGSSARAGGGARPAGGAKGGAAPGALSRKPAGMGSAKSGGARGGATNPSRPQKSGLGGGRSSAAPKPYKGGALGGGKRPGGAGPGGLGGGGTNRKPGLGSGSSRGGLLKGRGAGSGSGGGGGAPGSGGLRASRKPGGAGAAGGTGALKSSKKTPGGASGAGAAMSPGKKSRAGKGGKVIPFLRRRAAAVAGKIGSAGKGAKAPGTTGGGRKKAGTARTPRHAGYTWKKNPLRKARGAVGAVCRKGAGAAQAAYNKVTSRKFRRRLHRVGTPFRAMFRGTREHGGKLLANAMRWGGRAILSLNNIFGMVRYSTLGPNWLKPLSRVFYWATSPLAKLVAVTRTWSWLTTWVYKTATARPLPRAAAKARGVHPRAGTGASAPAPTSGGRAFVPSPATASAGKGTPVDTSPVLHAYPLIFAADAIREAARAFAESPADSMKGYEAVIQHLGHVEFAMCHLLHDIATVTEEDFKVNNVIPDQYRTLALHFLMLGGFVDGAHKTYREVHAEQIENIENPTWQGRKWDIGANWPHIMPVGAWSDPTVHAVPLLLASSAVRDAGAHIRINPAGSMVGYEMTIEHLAPLAEALHYLMETVATVTETEFSVHPAITAMHRDAGQRFRDLGGAIQGVHILYRTLHAEQLFNLENPSYQAAKWDQARNA